MSTGINEFEQALLKLKRKQRNSGIIYALIPIGIILAGLYFFGQQLNAKRTEFITLSKQITTEKIALVRLRKEFQEKTDSLKLANEAFASEKAELLNLRNSIIESAQTNTQSVEVKALVEESNNANKEILQVQRQIQQQDSPIDTGINVVYYIRAPDKDIVTNALARLKVKYVTHKAKPSLSDLPSNFIGYGEGVDPKYAHMIALALVRDGIEIKEIIKFESKSKSKRIEIGYRTVSHTKNNLTVDQIKDFSFTKKE